MSSIHNEMRWFAVYTQSRTEKKVFERLSKLKVEAFLPLITTVRQWSDRKKKIQVPLIRSYVFVYTGSNKLNDLLAVPGVLNILKYLGKPAVVRDVEIENLKILANNSEQIRLVKPLNLIEGEDIEVVKGPFMGLMAKFLTSSGKYRIIVEVEALNSYIEVTLPINAIRKINT